MSDPINTGYARALLEMAQAEGVTGRVEEELFRLRELLKANPELLQFLKDPNVKAEGKRKALSDLFQGRVHPLVLSTLITLSDQDRAGRVLHVIEEFSAAAAAAQLVPEALLRDILAEISTENAMQETAALASRARYPSSQGFFEAARAPRD